MAEEKPEVLDAVLKETVDLVYRSEKAQSFLLVFLGFFFVVFVL